MMKRKKFALVLGTALFLLNSTATAATAFAAENNTSVSEENDINFREQKNKEFEKLFATEMMQAKQMQSENGNILSRMKSPLEKSKIILDSEKTEGNNYYRLQVYSDGAVAQTGIDFNELENSTPKKTRDSGIIGGAFSTTPGSITRKNAIAYTNNYSSASLNSTYGHTVKIKFDYTTVLNGYDYISNRSIYDSYYVESLYSREYCAKESSVMPAFMKYSYKGRVMGSPVAYKNFLFTINVGNNKVTASVSQV